MCIRDRGYWIGEIWDRRKSGEEYAKLLTVSAIYGENGEIKQYVGLFSDITESKIQEQKLEYLANYDSLTGLANRSLFTNRLKKAMSQSRRNGQRFGLAYLDLDGFKLVNDTHGHDVGDRLLQKVSMKIQNTLREGDTLARLGGDEFVMILHDAETTEATTKIIERIQQFISQPVDVDGTSFQLSASIGVTFFPQHKGEITLQELVCQADKAMYQAKKAGQSRYIVFNPDE